MVSEYRQLCNIQKKLCWLSLACVFIQSNPEVVADVIRVNAVARWPTIVGEHSFFLDLSHIDTSIHEPGVKKLSTRESTFINAFLLLFSDLNGNHRLSSTLTNASDSWSPCTSVFCFLCLSHTYTHTHSLTLLSPPLSLSLSYPLTRQIRWGENETRCKLLNRAKYQQPCSSHPLPIPFWSLNFTLICNTPHTRSCPRPYLR